MLTRKEGGPIWGRTPQRDYARLQMIRRSEAGKEIRSLNICLSTAGRPGIPRCYLHGALLHPRWNRSPCRTTGRSRQLVCRLGRGTYRFRPKRWDANLANRIYQFVEAALRGVPDKPATPPDTPSDFRLPSAP